MDLPLPPACRLLGYEGVEVINPDGGKEDAEEEAARGRWQNEVCYFLIFLLQLEGLFDRRSSLIFLNVYLFFVGLYRILVLLNSEILLYSNRLDTGKLIYE